MTRNAVLVTLAAILLAAPVAGSPSQGKAVTLPKPDIEGRIPLETVLGQRRSVREYAPGAVTLAEAGQLLWAAQGITGPDGKRTAPSARAVYPLEVYVVANDVDGLARGVYCYEPRHHALFLAVPGDRTADLAAAVPRQDRVARAPLVVVVVADSVLAAQKFGARAERWVAMEVGFVVQDVYLEATALDLGTVMVGGFQDAPLRAAIGLPEGRVPYAVMPVGRRK